MASTISLATLASHTTPNKPGVAIGTGFIPGVISTKKTVSISGNFRFRSLEVKATESDQTAKPKVSSLICPDCEGNGIKQCHQCEGSGINSKDHFDGRFKAGAMCWLCRAKREILCGNCNGAGFVGGFMSTGES
ncbi:hypothetical protein Droror1_Dr00023834 [Drosera rotundifolia]